MRRRSVTTATLALATLVAGSNAGGAIINVPVDAASIQAAINLATNGDVVEVTDGTWAGASNRNLDFGGKLITVRSMSGNPALCTIDCEGVARGFVFHGGENSTAMVSGFTILNGSLPANAEGAAILIIPSPGSVASSPTITNCVFRNNTADFGGAMSLHGSASLVTNCQFLANNAAFGAGMYITGGSPALTNCVFFDNIAQFDGGGMYITGAIPTLSNCTFGGNDAAFSFGGGIRSLASQPQLRNCVLWGNTDASGSLPIAQIAADGPVSVVYSTVQGTYPGTGNTGADPLFADASTGNLRLTFGSPAIDAGNNTLVADDSSDLDGDGNVNEAVPFDLDFGDRFRDDPNATDTGVAGNGYPDDIVDMGAYEAVPITPGPLGKGLAVTFAGLGTWIYDDDTGTYTSIHPVDAVELAPGDFDNDGGDEVAMTFAGSGTWIFDGDTGAYTNIHGAAAALLAAGDFDNDGSDELAMTFTGYGTWIYDGDTGTFAQIHPADAALLTAGDFDNDGSDELAMTFTGYGTWIYDDDTGLYTQLHPADAALVTAGDFDNDGSDELAMTFVGSGTWTFDFDDFTGLQIHPAEAALLTAGDFDNDGSDELAMTFTGFGTWIYDDDTVTYTSIHFADAALLAAGD